MYQKRARSKRIQSGRCIRSRHGPRGYVRSIRLRTGRQTPGFLRRPPGDDESESIATTSIRSMSSSDEKDDYDDSSATVAAAGDDDVNAEIAASASKRFPESTPSVEHFDPEKDECPIFGTISEADRALFSEIQADVQAVS